MVNEKTPVPLGMVFTVMGLIMGGTAWLTTLQIETTSNGATLHSIEARQSKYFEIVERIDKELAEIKGELRRFRP